MVGIRQLDWMDTHNFMVKTGQSRRRVDAVSERKSRRNGKQEKADVSRRQEKARGSHPPHPPFPKLKEELKM